jgi:hypothetical protein
MLGGRRPSTGAKRSSASGAETCTTRWLTIVAWATRRSQTCRTRKHGGRPSQPSDVDHDSLLNLQLLLLGTLISLATAALLDCEVVAGPLRAWPGRAVAGLL